MKFIILILAALYSATADAKHAKHHVFLPPLETVIAEKDLPEITDCKSLAIHLQNSLLQSDNVIAQFEVTPATLIMKDKFRNVALWLGKSISYARIPDGSQRLLDCLVATWKNKNGRDYLMQVYQDMYSNGNIMEHYIILD